MSDDKPKQPDMFRDGEYVVRTINSPAAFAEHAGAWDAALARYDKPSIHLSADYINAVWAAHGTDIAGILLIVEKAEKIVAVAPLQKGKYRYRGLKLSAVFPFDYERYGRSDVAVMGDAHDIMPILERTVRRLGVDLWHLDRFPLDSHAYRYLADGSDRKLEEYARYDVAVLDTCSSWEDYLATKSKNFRRSYKRMQAAIEGLRPVFVTGEYTDLTGIIADVSEISDQSWKSENGSNFSDNSRLMAFLQALMDSSCNAGNFVGVLLYDEDRPVAFTFGSIYNGRLYALETSFVPEYGDRSAGIASYAMLMKHAFDTPHIMSCDMDVIKANGAYKRRWSTHCEKKAGAFVLLGGFGSLAIRMGRALSNMKGQLRPTRAVSQAA